MMSLTFTTSNWDTAQMVTVSAAGDSDATHDSATLTHTASGGDYGTVSADLPVTVTDNTRMRLVAVVERVSEGGSLQIRARLPMPLDDNVSITVTVAPNGGRADEYELSDNTTLTIAAGTTESTGNVVFTSLDDFTYTGTRYFDATLTPDHPRVDADIESFAVVDDDNNFTVMSITPSTIFENGGEATLIASKNSLHEGVVKMTVSLEPSDRATLSGTTLTFQPGATYATETLTITAVDNADDEPDQTITISAKVTEGRSIRTPLPLTLTIVDDEDMSPEVALVLTPPVVREGLVSTVTAVASGPLDDEATITVSASPGHADTRTDDYVLSANTVLTIPSGGTRSTGTVTIATVDDQLYGAARRRRVMVSGTVTGGGGVADPADQTLIVQEDDERVRVSLMATPATIAEGEVSTITMRSLQGPMPANVTVTLSEDSDAAELSADPVLMIAAGETESTGVVTLTAVDDDNMRNEVVLVTLVPSTDNAFVRFNDPIFVYTLDDDTTSARLTVSPVPAHVVEGETSKVIAYLGKPLSDDVTVTIGVNEAHLDHTVRADDYTLSANRTLTIRAGEMRSTGDVTLASSNDEYYGPLFHRRVVLDIASVTGIARNRVYKHSDWNIFEDEAVPRVTLEVTPASIAENGGQSKVTARLNTKVAKDKVAQAVEVTISAAPVGTTASGDFTQIGTVLTIPAGEKASTGTVTIGAVDDDVDGPDKHLVVTGAVTVVGMPEAGLVAYPYPERLTIRDDDESGLTVSPPALTIGEGNDGTYTVVLKSRPPGNVDVSVSGTAGTDLTLSTASLTFTPGDWNVAQPVTVTAGQDDDASNDMELLTHTASRTEYGAFALPVTVTDDDESGLTVSPPALTIGEGDDGTYTVVLKSRPPGNVDVSVSGTAGTDLTLSTASLTFTPGDWNVAQPVTVTAGQDDDASNDMELLTHTASRTEYGAFALPVTVTDDDESGLTVSPPALTIGEGDDGTYTVVLKSRPPGNVDVSVSGTAGTDLTLSTASLTFTPGDWNVAQPVTVTAGQDDDASNDMELLTHTASRTEYGAFALPVTVTDDDGTTTTTGTTTRSGLTVSPPALTIGEGDDGTYTVVLKSRPPGNVDVSVSGTAGTDLTLSTASLTFTPGDWNVAQPVTVTAGQDDDASNDMELLTHTASRTEYGAFALPVTVTDDDESGLTVSPPALTIGEGDDGTYTVVLKSRPPGNVDVSVSGTAGTDLTLSTASLTFTPGDWNVAQPVTVTAGQDDDASNDMELLTHTASRTEYGAFALPVTVTDDDGDGAGDDRNRPPAFYQSYTFDLEENRSGRASPVVLGTVRARDPDGDAIRYSLSAGDRARFTVSPVSGTVSYIGDGEDFESGPSQFELQVTAIDGQHQVNVRVVVRVVDVAEAPDAADDEAETPEDTPTVIDVLSNDRDLDGDLLRIVSVGAAEHGTTAMVSDGVRYAPELNWHGTDRFTYTVSDEGGLTATATVTVTVLPVNDPPEAVDDEAETLEDTPTVIDVLSNDRDLDGDLLRIVSVGAAEHGTTAMVSDGVRYAPELNWHGTDRFTYTVSDEGGLTATATVTVTVLPVNDPPEAVDDEAETLEDTPTVIDVLSNDRDLDGDLLRIVSVGAAEHGTTAMVSDGVRYAPELNWHGTDRFTYTVSDEGGLTATATVTVTVLPVNDPPEAVDDEAETLEDEVVVVDVLANDTDLDGDPFRVMSVGPAGHGATAIASRRVRYSPDTNWYGTDRFTYTIADPDGLTATATVTVTVLPVNDAPEAVGVIPDQALEEGGAPVTVDLTPYFTDADGDVLTYAAASSDETAVTATVTGATLTLSAVVVGAAAVTVTASDVEGLTGTQTFGVQVGDRLVRAVLTDTLAALGRGHLSSARSTIGRHLEMGGGATRMMVGGQFLSLDAWDWMGAGGLERSHDLLFRAAQLQQGLSATDLAGTARRMGGGVGGGWDRLLQGTDVLLSFGGEDEAAGPSSAGGRRWTVWGQGDVQTFRGAETEHKDYDGDLRTGYLGLDARLSEKWLVGAAVARSGGGGDWQVGPSSGRLTTALTVVHPYLRWGDRDTSVWALAGIGLGSAENMRMLTGKRETSPLRLGVGLVEGRRRLATTGGGLTVDVRGEASWARLRTGDGDETVDGLEAGVRRVRTGVEVTLALGDPSGLQVAPFGAVSTRHDGGAGQTGVGLEVAGGVRLTGGRVRVEAQGRMLALHTATDYQERGVSVTASVGAGQYEPGLTASIRPRWGAQGYGAESLWQDQFQSYTYGAERDDAAVDARVGYGLRLPGGRLLTPFGGYGQMGTGRRMQLGANLGKLGLFGGGLDSSLQVEFVGERYVRPRGGADHRLALFGIVNLGAR